MPGSEGINFLHVAEMFWKGRFRVEGQDMGRGLWGGVEGWQGWLTFNR